MADGVVGTFYVTPYAVKRYQKRIRPGVDTKVALDELIALTSAGRCVGPYTGRGILERVGPHVRVELWRGPRVGTRKAPPAMSNIRFVVAYGPGELPQVITVLPNRKGRP